MSGVFANFLSSISGENSPFKRMVPYSLNQDYQNKMYQEILASIFGEGGCTVSGITENKVLSAAHKSFYLKLALLSTPEQCATFLDYIYAAIEKKSPGHYLELLLAIKKINDYSNNSLVSENAGAIEMDGKPCNPSIFKNIDTADKFIAPSNVRRAIRNLLKPQIESIAKNRLQEISSKDYANEQLAVCAELEQLQPNPYWRMDCLDITINQIINTHHNDLIRKFHVREQARKADLMAGFAAHCATGCGDPLMCLLRVTSEEVQMEHKRKSDAQLAVIKADVIREEHEVALRQRDFSVETGVHMQGKNHDIKRNHCSFE